MNLRIQNI